MPESPEAREVRLAASQSVDWAAQAVTQATTNLANPDRSADHILGEIARMVNAGASPQAFAQALARSGTAENFTLAEKSVLSFLNLEIPESTNLAGNRWLTRDGSLFVVAPSGHGKSSFAIALAIHWAIGRIAFGLRPARPLKMLLLEAEDDDADNKAFVQVTRTMELSPLEWSLLATNTRIEFRRDLTGERFFRALEAFLSQWSPDVLIINPLSGFYTGSMNDEEKVSEFLRARLNPLMVKFGCAPLIMAHMPKSQIAQLAEKEWYEWMYAISGTAALTNWARAMLVFCPTPVRGTYRFIAAKRAAQTGWSEPEFYFSHSTATLDGKDSQTEVMAWVPATAEQIERARPPAPPSSAKRSRREYSCLEVHNKMSPIDSLSRDQFRSWCKEAFNMGINTSDRIRRTLIDDGWIEVIDRRGKGNPRDRLFKKILNQNHL